MYSAFFDIMPFGSFKFVFIRYFGFSSKKKQKKNGEKQTNANMVWLLEAFEQSSLWDK